MTQLTRWANFRDLISLREAMDRLLEESVVRPRTTGSRAIPVDMYETEEALMVKAAIPGVDPEDIDITITGDTLTITGEIRIGEEAEEAEYICCERPYGSFSRSLAIPVTVETDEAEAEFEDGILTLTMPKAEEVKPKTIQIKSQ